MNKNNDPITDDAELAKVLEGMQDPPTTTPLAPASNASATGIAFDDDDLNPAPYLQASAPPAYAEQAQMAPPMPPVAPVADNLAQPRPDTSPVPPTPPQPAPAYAPGIEPPAPSPLSTAPLAPVAAGSLDAIKKDALDNLRPLVDKLNLPADEKFDTLLLLIRSTDDQSLVTPAYDAARNISDETKRAQALLDIIKEIDYFSHPGEQPPK